MDEFLKMLYSQRDRYFRAHGFLPDQLIVSHKTWRRMKDAAKGPVDLMRFFADASDSRPYVFCGVPVAIRANPNEEEYFELVG